MTIQPWKSERNGRFHGRLLGRREAVLSVVLGSVFVLGGCQTISNPPNSTDAPQSTVVYNQNPSFSIGIAPDRAPPVRIGEKLGFSLSSSANGYGHLYLLTASGSVLALAENLPMKVGKRIAFPSSKAGYALRARPPVGQERILFLTTRQPFAGFAGGAAKDGPAQIPVSAEDFIRQLNMATRALPDNAWVITEEQFEIIAA